MFNHDDLDVQQELTRIPPEYQDVFRQALEGELAERAAGVPGDAPPEQTETDVLRYLRQRRDDFRRGAFIRPDGRPDIVIAGPEMLFTHGLLGLAAGRDDEEAARARRLLRLKVAGFVLLVALFLFFALRGRATRGAGGGGAETAAAATGGAPTPAPALPDVGGGADSLQTIGGLGAALTLGRPSALALHYAATEKTIALPVDPSRATPRGELRYNAATMASESPVAVWLFGTVVNYGIGLPDSLVRNLQAGDRIVLNTDTGAALAFVVSATWRGSSHETAAVLSQNRPGMTLFALPAVADDDVALAFAAYDVAAEANQGLPAYERGDTFALAGWGEMAVTELHASQTAGSIFRIVINGTTHQTSSTSQPMPAAPLLSLVAGSEQTPAVPLAPAGDAWEATFSLPATAAGLPLYAELRTLPAGEMAVVHLGTLPDLLATLQITGAAAHRDPASGAVTLAVEVHNPGEGAVYLDRHFLRVKGGDALEESGQVWPGLPILLEGGETVDLTFAFPLPVLAAVESGRVEDARVSPVLAQAVQLQIGAGLWEIALPAAAGGPGRP